MKPSRGAGREANDRGPVRLTALSDARPENTNALVEPLQPVPEPEPPPCPDGWRTGPPDYVGIGAQRCGTTWWHRLISAHPQVCFKRGVHRKEVHFFDTLGDRDQLSKGEIERYLRHFPRPRGDQLVGEWTPEYIDLPRGPHQLAQAAPNARLLVLIRDPVDRYASGFARASRIAAEMGVEGIEAQLVQRHIERGMYFEQISRVLDANPRERVLILQYEACRANRQAELERTYAFLGIDPGAGPPADQLRSREPRERALPAAERERLGAVFAPDVRKLADLLPELDLSLWKNVAGLL
jgi:Sulfotransferase domain